VVVDVLVGVIVLLCVRVVLDEGVIEGVTDAVGEGEGVTYSPQQSCLIVPQLLSLSELNPYATASPQSSIPPELFGSPPAHMLPHAELEYALLVPSDQTHHPSDAVSL
jgi:hypothetical protein